VTPEDNMTLEEMAAQDGDAPKPKTLLDEGGAVVVEPGDNDEVMPDEEAAPVASSKPAEESGADDGPVLDDEPLPDVPPLSNDKAAQDEAMPEEAGEEPAVEESTKTAAGINRDRISGVFSSQTVAKVGTGTTVRKMIQKAYWFAEEGAQEENGSSIVFVQPLNNNNIPSGPKEALPLPDFLERFNPELEYYQAEVYPKMKEMNSTLKRAEQQREQGALYSAQFEYEATLNFDEQNVRANFGLGLTYMERGETEKAGDIFERVVGLDAAFAPEHKHLFNEFGINLRKSKLIDQAVEYYTRALEITENDENLYYNIARAYFEQGDKDECKSNLAKALELNPSFEEANKFMEYLNKEE